MAPKNSELIDLFEEALQEIEDEAALNPDIDLSWEHSGGYELDFESDYHERDR